MQPQQFSFQFQGQPVPVHIITAQAGVLAFLELMQGNVVLANRLRPEAPVTVYMLILMGLFPKQRKSQISEASHPVLPCAAITVGVS